MGLTLIEAKRIADGAISKAVELKIKISVAVCNREGRLSVLNRLNRMDGVSRFQP